MFRRVSCAAPTSTSPTDDPSANDRRLRHELHGSGRGAPEQADEPTGLVYAVSTGQKRSSSLKQQGSTGSAKKQALEFSVQRENQLPPEHLWYAPGVRRVHHVQGPGNDG